MKESNRCSRELEVLLLDNRNYETSGHTNTLNYWVQETLNALGNSGLVLNGQLNEATKSALRAFQSRHGLPTTGSPDPPTERRLMEERALKSTGLPNLALVSFTIQAAKTKIEDWTAQATPPKDKNAHLVTSKYRNLKNVWALVLHQMAFKRRNKNKAYSAPESYLSTRAHFCILFDGRIIQLYPISRMIWHSQCTSPGSVGVEFEGNFANTEGKWWYPRDKDTGKVLARNEDRPTKAQIEAGRFLMQYLQTVAGFKNVLAHRQSSKDRTNDPGPDIWYNVGQWAVNNLGVSDGGTDFKCGDGNPIQREWRNWHDSNLVDGVTSSDIPLPTQQITAPVASSSQKSDSSVSKVHQANRYFAEKLGWDAHRVKIYPLLGFPNSSPNEVLFAEAVAGWQRKNGFSEKDSDGILGPKTWEKMKQSLRITDSSNDTSSTLWSALASGMQQAPGQAVAEGTSSGNTDWTKKTETFRRQYVMNRLIKQYHFPPNGAAGIVGNLEAESIILPNKIEGSNPGDHPMYAPTIKGYDQSKKEYISGPKKRFSVDEIVNRNPRKFYGPRYPGVGLAQWTYSSRRKGLFEHVYNGRKGGGILFDMDAQIDYLVTEMKRGYKDIFRDLMRKDISVVNASDAVLSRYEKPDSILYKIKGKDITIMRNNNRPDIPLKKIKEALSVYDKRARLSHQALRDYQQKA